jgi:F-box and WD-40 domain protein CDC4
MSTQHSTRHLLSQAQKDSRMKRRPSVRAPKPLAIPTTVSPLKTSSSTLSTNPINQHSLPSMAQFTFAPTSTQTVVTTTTTTTTTFPPLVFPPPRLLDDLDPRVHPLALADTPEALKSFTFNIDGKPTQFRESDDPQRSLFEVCLSVTDLPSYNKC